MELHYFDPASETAILYRKLPHWSQAGVVCLITCRLDDSMPQEVVERWHRERREWLRAHGINPDGSHWRAAVQQLDRSLQRELFTRFSSEWHDELDKCHGACVLQDPENSKIVADSLLNLMATGTG